MQEALWVIDEEEGKLDKAIYWLVVADRRVREAAEANRMTTAEDPAAAEFRVALGAHMNRRGLGARRDTQPLAAKAPGGKYNYGQVSDIVRKVATNPKLGRQSAVAILDRDGGGVANVSKLKPENLDKVYEACRVLLVGEGLLPALTGREKANLAIGKTAHEPIKDDVGIPADMARLLYR